MISAIFFVPQCDVRKPSVLRVAPAPLYNSFCDVFKFVTMLVDICRDLNGRIFNTGTELAFVGGEEVGGGLRSEDEDTTSNSSHELENMSTRSSRLSQSSSANHASNSSLSVASSSSDSETDPFPGSHI